MSSLPPIEQNSQSILDKVLVILRSVSEVLVHAENHHDAMQRIVGIIAQALHADDCSICVYNPADDTLTLAASYALNPTKIGKAICGRTEGIIGQCFESQQTLNIANHHYHPRFKQISDLSEEPFNSFLTVPLSFGGKNLGVLVIQSTKTELFPSETVDLIRSLAPQTASFIINTELFEHTLALAPQDADTTTFVRKRRLKGVSVSQGISHGYAYRIRTADSFSDIVNEKTDQPEAELDLLARAVTLTKQQTLQLEQCALSLLTEADSSIFATHLLMLDDHLLNERLRETIRTDSLTAEASVKACYYFFEEKFQRLPDQIFRERIIDLKDVLLRLVENIDRLRSTEETDEIVYDEMEGRELILVAAELLPSELMRIPIDSIKGIVCEQGGNTSHAAILAKALDIPALMSVKGLLDNVQENDELILDAFVGVLYIEPDEAQWADYADILDAIQPENAEEEIDIQPHPALTADGHPVTLRANLSLLNEATHLHTIGAQGVGLYRSEFMFMMRETLPSEQEQYNIFSKLVQSANGEVVTIRILDIGADKPVPCIPMPKEENPALGVRAIRLLKQRGDIMIPHLRAILRAGSSGPVRILLPMIATGAEIRELYAQINDTKAKLRAQGIPHGDCKVGIMMETPSLLFELKHIMKYIDFLSVGSNDLLQYLFAADRGNSALAYLTDPLNPTFMQVLKQIVDTCIEAGVPASICGELAGSYYAAPILVGMGYRELSMSPKRIPTIREVISHFTLDDCETAAAYATTISEKTNIAEYMKTFFAKHDLETAVGAGGQ